MTVLGWFLGSYFAADDNHKSSLREDRRDAFIGLLETSESCIDIANEPAVQQAFEEWLAVDSGTASTEPVSPNENGSTAPDVVLEANENRDFCAQRLRTARGAVDLLSGSETIRLAAKDLTEKTLVLHDSQMELLRLSAPDADSDERDATRDAYNESKDAYDTAVETYVKETGENTRSGPSFLATVFRALLFLALCGAGVALWLVWPRLRAKRTDDGSATQQ